MVVGFALTLVVKIARSRIEIYLPMWVMDSLPNFICGAVIPFAILSGNRAIRFHEFLSFCGLIALGLIVYELVQIAMPNRTFELNDLIATPVGALLPVSLGWMFFLRNMQAGKQSHALEPAVGPDSNGESSPPAQ